MHFHIFGYNAWRALDRRIVAQNLLCCSHNERWVVPEQFPLGWVTHERQCPVGNEVDGGLMAGDEEQDGIAHYLIPGHQPLPFSVSHEGKEVVPGVS